MQNSAKTRHKLLVRMLMALLPASALPLFCFGYIAIRSHYDSLRAQSLTSHKMLVTFMARQLESDVDRSLQELKAASDNEVFKTQNLFMIREALAGLRSLSGELKQVIFLDKDLRIVAVDPPSPAGEGKIFSDGEFGLFGQGGFATSSMFVDDAGTPEFYGARKITGLGGQDIGYLVCEVSLHSWAQISRAIIRNQASMLAALLPRSKKGDPIRLNDIADPQFWSKIAAIRAGTSEATEQSIGGEDHHVMFQEIEGVPVRLVVAQPIRAIFAAPRQVMMTYAGIMLALFLVMSVLLVVLARGITGRVRQIADAAAGFTDGRLEMRAPVSGGDELALLAETFNKMGDSLQASHLRMKVLYKSIMELFACSDADNLMRKAVELACTQCLGDAAWFLPHQSGHEVAFAEEPVFIGLHGWIWKNHRSSEIDAREAGMVWKRAESDRLFNFSMKNQSQEVGVLRVAYRRQPDETMVSLLHSLISLVEMALSKQELVQKGAKVSTELEMAEAVQRNIMADNVLVAKTARIAYHYQPASRLGGDWFFIIEDKVADSLHVIMGDVTGHGLAQGLVTTAVKGALDVIEHLMRAGESGRDWGPATIITFLQTVVGRVAGRSELTMTCLAAQIDFRRGELRLCNAGHTFPILVRAEGSANMAQHLHKNQQPMLGYRAHDSGPVTYTEAVYSLQPKDLLVIYTDGLTEAQNLKSQIFGRFLFRSLRKPREYHAAEELKDEILEMFRYYTQNSRVDDDVCFLVVQMQAADGVETQHSA